MEIKGGNFFTPEECIADRAGSPSKGELTTSAIFHLSQKSRLTELSSLMIIPSISSLPKPLIHQDHKKRS